MRLQLSEFSQTEHTCVISTQLKKQNVTSIYEVPLPCACFQSLLSQR